MSSINRPIGVRMPPNEYEVIEKAVKSGKALNAADYVRQAIREKIARDDENNPIMNQSKSVRNPIA